MEQSIENLVDSIKKEGIEKAKVEAEKIISDAKSKADKILQDARSEKEKMILDAKKEIELSVSSGEAALKQAGRNVSIQLKKSIEDTYSSILKSKSDKALDSSSLVSLIKEVVKGDVSGKVVQLGEKDLEKLRSTLNEEFRSEIQKGLEFKSSPQVKSGFRVAEKDGSAYLDLSSEKCSELLFPYLSEHLRGVLGDK